MNWRANDTRTALRWFHIVASVILATYVYSPWQSVWAFDLAVKLGLVPLLALSGVWMWKQASIRQAIGKLRG